MSKKRNGRGVHLSFEEAYNEGDLAVEDILISEEMPIDEYLELFELHVALRKAIESMSFKQKRVLIGKIYHGLKNGQLAKELGISESRVSRIATRAIPKLQEKLRRLGFDIPESIDIMTQTNEEILEFLSQPALKEEVI